MKVRAHAVTRLGNDKYMVIYIVPPGAQKRSALSDWPVQEGQDVIVREGRVVR